MGAGIGSASRAAKSSSNANTAIDSSQARTLAKPIQLRHGFICRVALTHIVSLLKLRPELAKSF